MVKSGGGAVRAARQGPGLHWGVGDSSGTTLLLRSIGERAQGFNNILYDSIESSCGLSRQFRACFEGSTFDSVDDQPSRKVSEGTRQLNGIHEPKSVS